MTSCNRPHGSSVACLFLVCVLVGWLAVVLCVVCVLSKTSNNIIDVLGSLFFGLLFLQGIQQSLQLLCPLPQLPPLLVGFSVCEVFVRAYLFVLCVGVVPLRRSQLVYFDVVWGTRLI